MSIYIKEPRQPAIGCVIWMHGLGSNAENMMGLANDLPLSTPIRHVFLDAPVRPVTLNNHMAMRAWYDIKGTSFTDREDREGILQSEALIRDVIAQQQRDGFAPETIFLAGFSQGAAMALFTGMRTPGPLAGIIALSGYLPLASEAHSERQKNTPVFIGLGEYDPVVLPAWTTMSMDILRQQGYDQITTRNYPMEHMVCVEEIHDLAQWISNALSSRELK